MRNKKNFLFGCIAIVLVMGVGLIILEAGCRLVEHTRLQKTIKTEQVAFEHSKKLFRRPRQNQLGFELKPNIDEVLKSALGKDHEMRVVTNDLGIREEKNIPLAKPAGTIRIIGLGDSVMFGASVGNDETMLRSIERNARKKGLNVQTLNFGIPDSNPGHAYYNFKFHQGAEYRPDILIYGFCLNDFHITCDRFDERLGASIEHQCEDPDDDAKGRLKKFVLSNSAMARVIFRPIIQSARRKAASQARTEAGTPAAPGYPTTCGFQYGCTPDMCIESKDRVKGWIKILADTFKEKNIKFLLVIFPHREQLGCALKDEMVPFHQQKTVLTICAELGIECYDTTADLLAEMKRNKYSADEMFWDHIHPNQRGHQILGNLIFTYIERLGWTENRE